MQNPFPITKHLRRMWLFFAGSALAVVLAVGGDDHSALMRAALGFHGFTLTGAAVLGLTTRRHSSTFYPGWFRLLLWAYWIAVVLAFFVAIGLTFFSVGSWTGWAFVASAVVATAVLIGLHAFDNSPVTKRAQQDMVRSVLDSVREVADRSRSEPPR